MGEALTLLRRLAAVFQVEGVNEAPTLPKPRKKRLSFSDEAPVANGMAAQPLVNGNGTACTSSFLTATLAARLAA